MFYIFEDDNSRKVNYFEFRYGGTWNQNKLD